MPNRPEGYGNVVTEPVPVCYAVLIYVYVDDTLVTHYFQGNVFTRNNWQTLDTFNYEY